MFNKLVAESFTVPSVSGARFRAAATSSICICSAFALAKWGASS
jgi:hypothetical protein